MTRAVAALLLWVLATAVCPAQAPTGTISGIIRDSSGGTVAEAAITAVSRVTRQVRRTTTGEHGEYGLPALSAGEYDLTIEAPGFQRAPPDPDACVTRPVGCPKPAFVRSPS